MGGKRFGRGDVHSIWRDRLSTEEARVTRYLLPMAMGLSVLVAGCEKKEEGPSKVTARDVERKAAEAGGAAADYARQEKDAYVARAQRAVDEGRAEVERLQAEARQGSAAVRGELERQIESMEARWKVAERRLGELKSASGEAWKDLRSGVDQAVEDLRHPTPS